MSRQIPFADLKSQYNAYKSEIDKAVLDVMGSSMYIMGPEVEKLEKKLRNRKRILSAILGAGGGALLGSKYGPAGALGGLLAGGVSGVAGNALNNLGHRLKTRINYGPDDDDPDLKYYKSLARQFANNQSII